jgi:hypothetical protein
MQPESLAMARNLAATCSVLAYQSDEDQRTENKIQQKKLFLHPRGTRGRLGETRNLKGWANLETKKPINKFLFQFVENSKTRGM